MTANSKILNPGLKAILGIYIEVSFQYGSLCKLVIHKIYIYAICLYYVFILYISIL